MKKDILVLAFGSNLDLGRMKFRCPGATPVGTAMIRNYQLTFRRSATGFYASIDKEMGSQTPALVWRMGPEDLERLDRFEGHPICYDRKPITTWVRFFLEKPGRRTCLAYILPEDNEVGMPSYDYFRIIDKGYKRWGFDRSELYRALIWAAGYSTALEWLADYYGRKGAKAI